MKYNKSNTKNKIIKAGLELFLSQGYDETTISQIVQKSDTSRSAFYHHFHGKDELLFSIAYMYDTDYDTWREQTDFSQHAVDLLISFNRLIGEILESSPYLDLYPNIYSLQVVTTGVRHILNRNRRYYIILRDIIKQGQEKGELITEHSYVEYTNMITSHQIGLTYSWCLQQQYFSLPEYMSMLLNPFLESLRVH